MEKLYSSFYPRQQRQENPVPRSLQLMKVKQKVFQNDQVYKYFSNPQFEIKCVEKDNNIELENKANQKQQIKRITGEQGNFEEFIIKKYIEYSKGNEKRAQKNLFKRKQSQQIPKLYKNQSETILQSDKKINKINQSQVLENSDLLQQQYERKKAYSIQSDYLINNKNQMQVMGKYKNQDEALKINQNSNFQFQNQNNKIYSNQASFCDPRNTSSLSDVRELISRKLIQSGQINRYESNKDFPKSLKDYQEEYKQKLKHLRLQKGPAVEKDIVNLDKFTQENQKTRLQRASTSHVIVKKLSEFSLVPYKQLRRERLSLGNNNQFNQRISTAFNQENSSLNQLIKEIRKNNMETFINNNKINLEISQNEQK